MSDEQGFLTKVDRDFLEGRKEYSAKQQRYERREAIAGRARQALQDFALLYDVLDEHERDRIFGVADVEDPDHLDDVRELRDGIVGTLAFLYLSLESEIVDERRFYRQFPHSFRQLLDVAISKAETERRLDSGYPVVAVELSVTVTPTESINLGAAVDKIAIGRPYELSAEEARAIIQHYDPHRGDPRSAKELGERVKERRRELGWDSEDPAENTGGEE